ncbi:MAG: trypsin-like peptidase domain-containing protein [Acetobacteraceae bacterium]
MRRLRLLLAGLLTFCLGLGMTPGIAAAPGIDWTAIAARAVPATVNILMVKLATGKPDPEETAPTPAGTRERFVGSGFIVDPSGIIVTNKHVIAGALWITVRLADGRELPAKLIAASPFVDLALLKVNAGYPLPVLKLGDGDAAKPGEPVLAIGDPEGVGTSLSAGIVSGTQRDLMNTPFDDYVQTDAAINHGNSGGPLLDARGRVIGVNTILLTNLPNEGSNGLGFAISSNVVADALRHLLHPDRRPIGWIGLHLQGMTPNLAVALGLHVPAGASAGAPAGALVTKVDPHSPAAAAGLQPGDVVLRYGNTVPSSARQLMRRIATTTVGARRVLEVWTRRTIRSVALTVRLWPGLASSTAGVLGNPMNALPPLPDLGLLLAPVSPLTRRLFKLGHSQGVLIAAVDRMSEAYSRGLRPGLLIERVQGQPVTTPAAARALIATAARQLPVVALLIRWSDGPRWISLHTGLHPGATKPAPPASARAGDTAPAAARAR